MLVVRVALVECGQPRLERRDHVGTVVFAEFDFRQRPRVVLRHFEKFEQCRDRLAVDLRRLEKRPAFVGDAIDAAMLVIAIRIAQIVLHVADDRVAPIGEVECAIRPDIDLRRAEVRVG